MARVSAPLASSSAWGTIADQLQFQRRATMQIARAISHAALSRAASNPSAPQQAQRDRYRAALVDWHATPQADRDALRAAADAAGLTVFNFFIHLTLLTPAPQAGTVWDAGATTWDAGATTWDT